jgi:hypothetical protein
LILARRIVSPRTPLLALAHFRRVLGTRGPRGLWASLELGYSRSDQVQGGRNPYARHARWAGRSRFRGREDWKTR